MLHKYYIEGKQVSEMVFYSFLKVFMNSFTRKKMSGSSHFSNNVRYSYDGVMRPMVEHRLEVGSLQVFYDVLFDQIDDNVNKDIEDL